MGRSKLKTLKETTLNTFFDLTRDLGISGQYKFNSQSNIIYWDNGSEIILKDLFLYPSDKDFDSLGSLEITGGFVDECNQVVLKGWQIALSRCRYKLHKWDIHGEETKNMEILAYDEVGLPVLWRNSKDEETPGLIPKMLGTCNPSKNWTYQNFYKPAKKAELPKNRKFIQALPTDNPHLPKSYLETLLSLDKNSKERLYFGNWEYDDDPATLIDHDGIADYWTGNHLTRSNQPANMFMTIDVARKGKDNTVFRIWDGFLCIARHCIEKSDLVEVVEKAKELAAKFKIPLSQIIADESGVGGGVVDFLKCKGFVSGSSPLKEMIGNEYKVPNYQNLRSQCGFKMAQKIMSREAGELAADSNVITYTTEEMEQAKQKDIDKDGKIALISKDVIKLLIGRSPDEWDSIYMRYWFELAPKMFTF